MAKNSITDYSKTASLNTDIQSVDIDEGCLPSGINNAIRELMADLAAMNDGTVSLTSPAFTSVDINGGTIDGVTIGGASAGAGTFTTGQFNTSLNVDGTVTADGVELSGTSVNLTLFETDQTDLNTRFRQTAGDIYIQTIVDDSSSAKSRLGIDHATGDISFYEDTGTTAKMFWDASAEALGIGTTSPTADLTVTNGSSGGTLSIGDNAAGSTSVRYLQFGESSDYSIQSNANSYMRFYAEGSERMRIDSSGNVLVGQTSADSTVVGIGLLPYGSLYSTRDGNFALTLNRKTSDGQIARFQKDGTTVGTIGVEGGDNFYITDNNNTGLNMKSGLIIPCNTDGSTRDNAIDLGASGGRFNDLYLGGGVYLGGTGSANKLDDYEIGTWSPHIKDSSNNNVKVTATDQGKYVKIGDIVHVHFRIYANAVSASFTGYPFVQLPFTTADSAELNGFQVAYRLSMNTIKGASTLGSTSTMKFSTVNENPYGSMINVGPYTLSGNVRFYGMLTYRAS